ncbi:MAG: GTPase Era [Nitrospiraceae bacterium]|nr:GTPase Era [Nitrospiraceae bacterium]
MKENNLNAKTNKEAETTAQKFRSGYVSIIGKPNAGKSTLLNSILGQKVSIVTTKPQTTRNRIIGIKTLEDAQIVFMDTPGIHKNMHTKLDEIMMREARDAMREVDIILFMVEPKFPGEAEKEILDLITGGRKDKAPGKKKIFLVMNKVDTVRKSKLLPFIQAYSELFSFDEVVPVSALTGDGVDILLERIPEYLPEGPMYYPEDLVTDQLERFMVSEIIREKVMVATFEEVPHAVAVEVVRWDEPQGEGKKTQVRGLVRISADIWVERDSQKGIIIGKSGHMLKEIGQAARLEAEKLLNARVFLELYVKLKKDWRSDTKSISELGF